MLFQYSVELARRDSWIKQKEGRRFSQAVDLANARGDSEDEAQTVAMLTCLDPSLPRSPWLVDRSGPRLIDWMINPDSQKIEAILKRILYHGVAHN